MINRIIEYSATNRGLVIILVLSLVVIGIWSIRNIPLDAIPDLSDPQVIIYTEWPGRSPDLVEAQITYPIVSAMLAAPRVSVVRGGSDYGFSYVYVIFDEGTDVYWGRSRVLEYLNKITGILPEGAWPLPWGQTPRASGGPLNMRWSTSRANTTWLNCARSTTGTCATGWKAFPV